MCCCQGQISPGVVAAVAKIYFFYMFSPVGQLCQKCHNSLCPGAFSDMAHIRLLMWSLINEKYTQVAHNHHIMDIIYECMLYLLIIDTVLPLTGRESEVLADWWED